MIQYQPDAVSAERRRPGTVAAAGMLLIVIAASNLLSIIISIATFDQVTSGLRDSILNSADVATTTPATLESAAHIVIGLQMVIGGVLAIVFVLLAVFVVRGSQGMRITTWVLTGIGVLCAGFGLLGNSTRVSDAPVSDPNAQFFTLSDFGPSWAATVSTVQWIVVLCSLIAIIVLLALPASHAFYRKPQAMLYPAMGPGGIAYPGYPVYQAYPGQAYPAGPPQYPPPQYPPPPQ